MQICLAAILSIAILLGNSAKLRAAITEPVPGDGDGHEVPVCPMCCQGPAAVPGIPGLPGPYGPVGPRGDSGLPGQKGDIGQNGAMGVPGPPGNPGLKGNDGIGLPGKIGPRGPPGLVGPSGEAGVKGQKGEPGGTSADDQRVAFTVKRRTASAVSSSHNYKLPFEEIVTLLPGSSFDLETGTFTCNVPGTYVFMFSANTFPGNSLYVHLMKNDTRVVTGRSSTTSEHEQVSGGVVLVLQRVDMVYLTMFGRVYSDNRTSFSGFLL